RYIYYNCDYNFTQQFQSCSITRLSLSNCQFLRAARTSPLSRLIMLLKRQFKNKKEPVQSVQETEAAQAKDDGDAQADSALIDNITAAGADNTESKNDIKTRSPSSNANFMPVAAPVESHIDDDEVSALDITGGNQRAAPQRTRTTSTSSSQVLGGEFETA
uniref:Transcription initiation factor TFIID subunit 11-like n=1 Tax=Macrostomum lignano TaxID=282301 RepID=A0A1I8HZH2_9PLAT